MKSERGLKPMQYKDKDGKVLYGFSQENLEKTNREIRKTNKYMQLLIIMVALFLVIIVAGLVWLEMNNIITRLIYG
ncbi:hypothetical protein HYS50_02010 [Candidatus Woesearchaeota archaeon]|nr:hypothetical protein [Candidatus Woesearchaeota archaeon]